MIWAVLGAYLTKRPPGVQAVVFGLCVGLFVAALAQANTREPVLRTVVIQVLAVAVVVGGLFFLGLRRGMRRPGDIPIWVHATYVLASPGGPAPAETSDPAPVPDRDEQPSG